MAEPWNVEKMLALGHLHADLEAKREIDPLMETLVPDPVYEFHPLGRTMRGGERVRRYYEQFFSDFMEKITGYVLVDEWANARSVVQEYDISVAVEGAPQTHRVVGILYAEDIASAADPTALRLGGERIYGSETLVRLFAGALYDELVPLG